ncbi:MAG: iron-sulfur cluster carrier protein ApbC [Woeseiaceae bacterium]
MPSNLSPEVVRDALAEVSMPGSERSLAALKTVVDEVGSGPEPVVRLSLPLACESLWPALSERVRDALNSVDAGVSIGAIELSTRIPAFGVQRSLQPLPGIANLIAVASGKGGVGKSTTAVNLALALQAEGARVGLLDADIYGPSIPRMLGLTGQSPVSSDGKTMQPLSAFGLQVMSIGFLVDDAAPMVWRGPMVTSALNQLLKQTTWQDLDYLIVDMPPGTGDIQLTLSQSVPVAGALIVTTPQDVALSDARKGLEMFRKVSVPVLGIVENMSTYQCPGCGEEASLFGQGGGDKLAADAGVKLLGELPLIRDIGVAADAGKPIVAEDAGSAISLAYRQVAIAAGLALAESRRDYSAAFTNIVIEDT